MTYDLDLIIEEDNIDLDLDFKEDVSILKGDPGKDGVNGRDGCSVCYVDISWPIYRSGEPLSGYNMDKSLFDPSTKIDDFGISSNGIFFKIISFDELDNSYFCNYKTTLKGGKGDKGDKGDAGVIRFIPVNVLPTEDIDASAIYLLPIADSTEEENRFTEHVYINGKWKLVYELVAQTFIGPRPAGAIIHHKSNDGWDNRPENLVYVSADAHSEIHRQHGKNCPDYMPNVYMATK